MTNHCKLNHTPPLFNIENNDLISYNQNLAQITNNYFSDAVKDSRFVPKISSITHLEPGTNAIMKDNLKANDNFRFQATNLMCQYKN